VLPWGEYAHGVVTDAAVLPELLHVTACTVAVSERSVSAMYSTGYDINADVHLLYDGNHYDVLYPNCDKWQDVGSLGAEQPFSETYYSR
jgi:hypothetical protein